MAEYVPSTAEWVRDQVEVYERTNGAEGTTLRDTGMPVVIVTNTGGKTGAIRKTPLMRVKDGANYVLVGSKGGAPQNPVWVYNLRANPEVEIRDLAELTAMRVREVEDGAERSRLWTLSVEAYPPYEEYQGRTRSQDPGVPRRAGLARVCRPAPRAAPPCGRPTPARRHRWERRRPSGQWSRPPRTPRAARRPRSPGPPPRRRRGLPSSPRSRTRR